MTTPSPDFGGTAAGSRLLGGNDLQSALDNLTTAVKGLTSAVQASSSSSPGGTSVPFGSTGQSFTRGSFPSMMSMAPSNSGPGGYSGSNVTAPSPMGGGAATNPAGTTQSAMGTLGSMASASLTSASQFGNQITMNQYAASSMSGMAPGIGMQQGMSAMYNQAFGSYGKNVNAIALNPADAAQMYSNLQGIAASPFVKSTALGRAGLGATNSIGYGTGLGGAASSAAAQAIYSPQTSFLMRQQGYNLTPRAPRGSNAGRPIWARSSSPGSSAHTVAGGRSA